MTRQPHATPRYLPPPRRPRHWRGWLDGCLALVALAVLAVLWLVPEAEGLAAAVLIAAIGAYCAALAVARIGGWE